MTCKHPPEAILCGPLYKDAPFVPVAPGDHRQQNIREQDELRPQWCSLCGAVRWYPHQEWGSSVDHARFISAHPDDATVEPLPDAPQSRYPLWCVDTGDNLDEERFRGVFASRELAQAALDELRREDEGTPEPHGVYGDAKIRRCRRVAVSEIDRSKYLLDEIVTLLADDVSEGGVPAHAWGNWEDTLVRFKEHTSEAIEQPELLAWLDARLQTRVFVCEGDEEEDALRAAGREALADGESEADLSSADPRERPIPPGLKEGAT